MNKELFECLSKDHKLKQILVNEQYELISIVNNLIANNGSNKEYLNELITKAEDQIQKLRNTIVKAESVPNLRNEINLAEDCIYDANKRITRVKKDYF